MTSEERETLLKQLTLAKRDTTKLFFQQVPAEDLRNALLPFHELSRPIDELVATGEAVFELIRRLDMKKSTKMAFYQLEKQFNFYRNLIVV